MFLPEHNDICHNIVDFVSQKFDGKSSVIIESFEKTLQLAALEREFGLDGPVCRLESR
jgi:hypothetical protein